MNFLNVAIGRKKLLSIAAMLACGALAASSANAAVTIVTGGDTGEGFNGAVPAVVAYSVNGTSGIAQNVTFPTNAVSVSVGAPGPTTGATGTSASFANNSASDATIIGVFGSFLYQGNGSPGGPPLTLTVTGLAAGSYTAEILAATDGSLRSETVSINGILSPDTITASNGVAVDSSISFTATGTGTDKIVLQPITDYAFLSGLVISSAATPEPASLMLLGLGSMGLLVRRRA